MVEGRGIDVPHNVVQLLMGLANAPTAVGKFVSPEALFDAEKALSQPFLPLSLDEDPCSDEEKDESHIKILDYNDWKAQCLEEDSNDELDESWLAEEAEDEMVESKYALAKI